MPDLLPSQLGHKKGRFESLPVSMVWDISLHKNLFSRLQSPWNVTFKRQELKNIVINAYLVVFIIFSFLYSSYLYISNNFRLFQSCGRLVVNLRVRRILNSLTFLLSCTTLNKLFSLICVQKFQKRVSVEGQKKRKGQVTVPNLILSIPSDITYWLCITMAKNQTHSINTECNKNWTSRLAKRGLMATGIYGEISEK